ncbi:hypothetical protein KAFR_0A06270 [Kazachstania africana CBS 2517]|uniref:Autophagy-related protein 33 n=1 Tax=Kazachstania africana (strain ATCC 22294 / BCRC 22015 / CBS 2517 / CECT 1963 / NBRC 1671 / NRRL Y-8276) TaxID=1071382 RepID=H2ANW2_KAZAF|nr:hypothetical protein KAFR_0A06270 [Kazachstania africana CBS 2517]CCF56062.1 hypothetical protein KAFR_0A06270 [Kazachstania africana CBS 2517]
MSVCLAITKTVAVSSLGLSAGLLTTSSIISSRNDFLNLLTSLDIVSQYKLSKLVVSLQTVSNWLSGLASVGFGVSYFAVNLDFLKHPYLLYGMILSPLSSVYLYYVKHSIQRKLSLQEIRGDDKPSIKLNIMDDSIVDLGPDENHTKIDNGDSSKTRNLSPLKTINRHLWFASSISILTFIQSVVGIYGEGQFV